MSTWAGLGEAAVSEKRVIDLSGVDYTYAPEDGGLSGTVTCGTLPHPQVGDYLLLSNGKRSARYLVSEVSVRVTEDDTDESLLPTYIAKVDFAPRRRVQRPPRRRPMIREVSSVPDMDVAWHKVLMSALEEAGGRLEVPFDMLIDLPEGVMEVSRDEQRRTYTLTLKDKVS